jgi:hypothetical protein
MEREGADTKVFVALRGSFRHGLIAVDGPNTTIFQRLSLPPR